MMTSTSRGLNGGLLQGPLQNVFDVLYELGVIDPVLKMDWKEISEKMITHKKQVRAVMKAVNQIHFKIAKKNNPEQSKMQLKAELEKWDFDHLTFLAMEVAREFAEFQGREAVH